jgi:hypothetical protein
LQLVARFPEKEEYVISTSEFQRIKAYMMKQTNAKAGISTDFDGAGDEGRPTLKKRQPDSTDTTTNDTSSDPASSSSSDGPPKLKKRDQEPAPAPSPSPEQ